jgi:glycosyltransferase involved in cell wall biosynthesis
VYNSEQFLKESIESVLNQTYTDIEIIVVNDGSTDNSLEILKQYEDKILIINQKNHGLASALNRGIEVMKGNWFKWFSPDDILLPETIEILLNTAKNVEQNTIVYSNWNMIDESGKKLRSFSESNYNELDVFNFNIRLLDGQQINVNTTLVPNSLFLNFRMNTLIDPVLVDYDFFLRVGLLYDTKFHLIEQPLIKFRVHQKQLSHQKIMNSLKKLESIRENVLSNLDNDTQHQYLDALQNYKKTKSISKKSLESGLKLLSNILPDYATDKILLFYLNKIRRSR